MSAPRVCSLRVARVEPVTDLMLRLVLAGDDVASLESPSADDHVWIVFPEDGVTRPPHVVNDRLEWPRPFPPKREYTIRKIVGDELWIDFALHTPGLAAEWVQRVTPGESVCIAGPKHGAAVPESLSRLVLLGDHTALPAIARWVEEVPESVRTDVAVQVPAPSERQDLARPATWLVGEDTDALIDHLEPLGIHNDGSTYLWAAGEAGLLKSIRRWARANGFARGTCDIAGYWRRGVVG